MTFMDRLRLALGLDAEKSKDAPPDRLAHLVKTVNEQSPFWWDAVNESRGRRGEPPIERPSWDNLYGDPRVKQ